MILRLLRLLAVMLGAMHTWAAVRSHSMNADGISYLDIGDAYLRGDWSAAINSVWSPLYSWILGLALKVTAPSMEWEFPVVHLVNFAIYLAAMACFEYFWRQVIAYKRVGLAQEDDGSATLPEWSWWILGYLLFIWSSLVLINVWSVTPDLLMATLVFLAGALVMRIRLGLGGAGVYAALGLVLGLAYLSKSVMFLIGFVFLGAALMSASISSRSIRRTALALVCFLAISLPFIGIISSAEGRLTFGDAGKLTYLRLVNGLPYPHWQGEGDSGNPEHPTRIIHVEPPIYEFGSPISGTYPVTVDPAYWYEGAVARFDLWQQVRRLVSSAIYYFEFFFHRQAGLTIGFLILYWVATRSTVSWLGIRHYGLSLIALAVFALYALVYVEDRYVAVFAVFFWADVFSNHRTAATGGSRSIATGIALVITAFLLLEIAAFNLQGFQDLSSRSARHSETRVSGPPGWPGEVALALQQQGLRPDEPVGVIGYAFDSYWARLARARIVAEMFGWQAAPFWFGDDGEREGVLRAFARAGARFIVAEHVPENAATEGWYRVGQSNYFIYRVGSGS